MLYLQAEGTTVVHSHIWQLVFCAKERELHSSFLSAVLCKINSRRDKQAEMSHSAALHKVTLFSSMFSS